MADTDIIPIPGFTTNAPVTATISAPRFPQLFVGKVWRFFTDGKRDALAGKFSNLKPSVDLGTPASNSGKVFALYGFVIHMDDNPPTQYEVVATLQQGAVSAVLKIDGGTGAVGATDEPFIAKFTFV